MNAKLPILSMEVVLWVGVQRKFSLNEYGNFLVLCVNRAVENCTCHLGIFFRQNSQEVQSTGFWFFCTTIAGGNENKGTERLGAPLVETREAVGWGGLIICGLSFCSSFFRRRLR